MRKRVVIIKRALSFLLIFLLSINSFAATSVSDNDGSAFITKAEFDALKSSFQSQIDTYNQGIDSKIDNAIATYLAGISIKKDPLNLYAKAVVTAGGDPIWLQEIKSSSNAVSPDINITQTLHHTGNVLSNIHFDTKYTNRVAGTRYVENLLWIGDTWEWTGGWSKRTNTLYFWGRQWPSTETHTKMTDALPNPYAGTNEYYVTTDQKKKKQNWTSQSFNHSSVGSGTLFISQTLGGKTYIKSYASAWYPFFNISVWFHTYIDYIIDKSHVAPYVSDNGKAPGTTHSTFTLTPIPGEKVTYGTKYGDDSTSVGDYGEMDCGVNKILDNDNYLNYLYSIKTDTTIYYVDEEYQGNVDTTTNTITIDDGVFYDIYWTELGGVMQTNTLKGGTVKYKPIKVNVGSEKLANFNNYIATSVIGEDTKNCSGLPIFTTTDDGQKVKIKMKIKSAHNNSVNVQFADKSFTKGVVPASNKLYSTNVPANSLQEYTLDVTNKGNIWVFISNNTNKEDISIDSATFDVQLAN